MIGIIPILKISFPQIHLRVLIKNSVLKKEQFYKRLTHQIRVILEIFGVYFYTKITQN